MQNKELNLMAAARYLESNEELRACVGAEEGAAIEPHELGGGEHNLNYWFQEPSSGGKYVLRVNVAPQPFHDNQVAYEFAALKALESSGCTPRPVYLDDSPQALGAGVIVESFCEGEQLNFDDLGPGDLQRAARLMAHVHAVPVTDSCPLYRPADPLRELYDECVSRYRIYRSSSLEDARVTAWMERLFSKVDRTMAASACNPADCRHIVNTETLPSHFLLSGDAGSFIDWERPIVGEVAQDVAYFVSPTTTFWDSDYLFPASEVDSLVQAYWREVDGRFSRGNFDERFQAWRQVTVLRSATWCCRALVQYRQDETHKTERTLKKLPVYLSDDFMDYLMRECFAP